MEPKPDMTDAEKHCRARHPAFMSRELNAKRAQQLRDAGRCGSLTEGAAFVCTLMSHGPDTNHQQQEIGGIKDGLVQAEWEW